MERLTADTQVSAIHDTQESGDADARELALLRLAIREYRRSRADRDMRQLLALRRTTRFYSGQADTVPANPTTD